MIRFRPFVGHLGDHGDLALVVDVGEAHQPRVVEDRHPVEEAVAQGVFTHGREHLVDHRLVFGSDGAQQHLGAVQELPWRDEASGVGGYHEVRRLRLTVEH